MLIPTSRISTRLMPVPIFVTRRWFSIHKAALLSRSPTLARTFANAISHPRSQELHWAPAHRPAFAWAAVGDPPAGRAVARRAAVPVAAAGMDSSWGQAAAPRPDHRNAHPG